MLINVSYPGVLGDNAGMSNNGKFRSHGWEVMVNWSDKIGKDFTYHVGGTYSFNTNKLTDIGAVSVLKSGFVDKQQGYPLNSILVCVMLAKHRQKKNVKNIYIAS